MIKLLRSFTLILGIFMSQSLFSQPQTGKFIDASVGLGITAPYEDIDVVGSGFYAQAEYVIGLKKWFGFRPYAGFIFTSKERDSDFPEFEATTNAFLVGGKARIAAPIPWVAPYVETGVGLSVGSFKTIVPTANINKSGVLFHVPLTIGLAVGKNHGVDIEFVYYYHPSAEQFAGAAAFGLSFPLN